MPRDIRELGDDPEAYAAELRRRWGGLLSYRYLGRSWSSMDLGPTDNTVTLRRDMRGPTGAILLAVLGIAAPEGADGPTSKRSPTRSSTRARSSTRERTSGAWRSCRRSSR